MTTSDSVFTYHAPIQLQLMTLAELETLWDLVPPERKRQYHGIYDQYVRSEGAAASDADELAAIEQLISHYYEQKFMVPLLPRGDHWVSVPSQIREVAEKNLDLAPTETQQTGKVTPAMLPVLILMGVGLLIALFLVVHGLSQRNAAAAGARTGTAVVVATPGRSPTPTPIALEEQDSIIRGGDSGSGGQIYPVNLRVAQAGDSQPRFFVVQRRQIQTTEWNYDPNPDIASYIAGLSVRPVIGIPWSETNALLFEYMLPGTIFDLQMNTGSTLRFEFSSKQSVNRSDTSWFRQAGPGLVLVLIGERNANTSEPTSNRIIVTAAYTVAQELATGGGIAGINLPVVDVPTTTVTATPFQRIDVQLITAEYAPGWVKVRWRIFNGRTVPVTLENGSIQIAFGYTENPAGPTQAAEHMPFELAPGQAVDLATTFSWQGEPYCTLTVFDYRFVITLQGKS